MNHPTPWLDQPASLMPQDVRLMTMAFAIANRAALADIETGAVRVNRPGGRWYDVRPMTDPREHCGPVLDMAAQTLAYAENAGLIQRHPNDKPPLVRGRVNSLITRNCRIIADNTHHIRVFHNVDRRLE
jgi:hypothetical protein